MRLKVQDFMSAPVITTTPGATASHAYDLMLKQRIGSLPVLGGEDNLVGIVTFWDLRDVDESTRVADIMSSDVVTVAPDTGLQEAAHLLSYYDIIRLPVLDAGGHVVGIVSRANIVRAVADQLPVGNIVEEARAAKQARRTRVRRAGTVSRRARKP